MEMRLAKGDYLTLDIPVNSFEVIYEGMRVKVEAQDVGGFRFRSMPVRRERVVEVTELPEGQ